MWIFYKKSVSTRAFLPTSIRLIYSKLRFKVQTPFARPLLFHLHIHDISHLLQCRLDVKSDGGVPLQSSFEHFCPTHLEDRLYSRFMSGTEEVKCSLSWSNPNSFHFVVWVNYKIQPSLLGGSAPASETIGRCFDCRPRHIFLTTNSSLELLAFSFPVFLLSLPLGR